MRGMGGDAARDDFFRRILSVLRKENVPYLIGGGYAFASYTGIRRDTKDLDLFIRPRDRLRALRLAKAAGYKSYVKSAHWLAKIESGEHFVDLIYSSGNGACPVDEIWFEKAVPASLLGLDVLLVAPEEMIWSKSFIMERHRFDGADVAHLLKAKARALDWDRLLRRFEDKWPVLLSHLILFRFIYPRMAAEIPDFVLLQLVDRVPDGPRRVARAPNLCQGTLLSFCEYLPDIHKGLADARLRPRGSMSQGEIDRWTAERK